MKEKYKMIMKNMNRMMGVTTLGRKKWLKSAHKNIWTAFRPALE